MPENNNPEIPIQTLLLHEPPMRWVDRLIAWTDHSTTGEVTIHGQTLMLEPDRGVPAWVGIEYMAQTIALSAGIKAHETGEPIPWGFLLGTRKFQCAVEYFEVGQTLTTHAQHLMKSAAGLAAFDCEIRNGDTVLATARLNVFEPPDINEYLEGKQP